VHPANNALKELRGFIVPVTTVTGEGKGGQSHRALAMLVEAVHPDLQKKQNNFVDHSIIWIMNKVIDRMQKPTPMFFQKLRNIGVALTAVAASLIAAPVALPVIIVKVAGYLAVAGTIAATISQAAVTDDE
jgi:hypothetical protein